MDLNSNKNKRTWSSQFEFFKLIFIKGKIYSEYETVKNLNMKQNGSQHINWLHKFTLKKIISYL